MGGPSYSSFFFFFNPPILDIEPRNFELSYILALFIFYFEKRSW